MRRGGELHGAVLAYETWGLLNSAHSNVVLLFTGLSPSSHARSSTEDSSPGWWESMVGPGQPIDTDRYFVICVNSLGSCFGSTGAASLNPVTGQLYRTSFPELTMEDVASAAHHLVESLGIRRLNVVLGVSMGGMAALAYAALFPARAQRLAVVSTAPKATAFAIAIHSLQREMVRSDPMWAQGKYAEGEMPVNGMRLARKLGMISYRSAEELQQRFGHLPITGEVDGAGQKVEFDFEVEAYLEHNAGKFVGGFDANCYLYLSRAMDLFDLAEHGGCVEAAFARMQLKSALVIGVSTDTLFPLMQQEEIAEGLHENGVQVEFSALQSIHGHDAFLVDHDRFGPVISRFMRQDI